MPEAAVLSNDSSELRQTGETLDMVGFQQHDDLDNSMYGREDVTNLETMPFGMKDIPLDVEIQETEVMDFFGNLLDSSSLSMYGNVFGWQ